MMDHWESTWGRGTNYILNLPPSKDGLISPALVASAAAFADERARRYGDGAAIGSARGTLKAGDDGLLLELAPGGSFGGVGSALLVDRLLLRETGVFTQGQQVMEYALEYTSADAPRGDAADVWKPLALNSNSSGDCVRHAYARCGGRTIGTHKLDALEGPVAAARVRLRILQTIAEGAAVPVSLDAFCVGGACR